MTFLLTDIEGSTGLWERGGGAFRTILADHHELLRRECDRYGGCEVKDLGDGYLLAFSRAADALQCAIAGQRALEAHSWPAELGPIRVRMALHTGDAQPEGGDYHGPVLHCAQRILMATHGGQIVCSEGTAGLLRRDLEPGVQLVDLGIYRLRGVSLPERLFQVEYPDMSQRAFPPLLAESAHGGRLPPQFTPFFGREREVQALRDLLIGAGHRLVTLTGPAGSGKTRLALAAAGELEARGGFPGPLWFVPLEDLTDPGLLPEKVLDALRLPRFPQLEPLEQVGGFLARQPSMLVLDNFEHLVAEGAPLVQMLLERAPSLTCLVTSRQRLGLPGEREFPVAPLPVPEAARGEGQSAKGNEGHLGHPLPLALCPLPEALLQCPSVRLFVDRAQAVRSDFQVTPGNAPAVAALCVRLEGLPLAIELAAARARVLTPQQMLARLERRFDLLVSRGREADSRHQSLRATLDWSYQQLSPELRRFFARLSVFRGGFTLEAAEAVCGEEGVGCWVLGVGSESGTPTSNTQHPIPILEFLTELQECSMVQVDPSGEEMRYRLLETLREYGAEQLPPEEWSDLARRHAGYYRDLAEQAELELLGAGQIVWLERLEREHDNLRAALDGVVEASSGDPAEAETGLRLAGALWEFWAPRGFVAEGQERLRKLLALPGASGRTAARAKALAGAGVLANLQGDRAAARALLEESLAIRRELNDRWGIASSLTALGFVARYQGDYAAARALQEQGLAIWRELGENPGIAWSLNNMADIAGRQGDFETERKLHEESLAIRRELGDQWGAAFSLSGLGRMACYQGDLEAARAYHEQSLAIRRELGDQRGIAVSLTNLGEIARRQQDWETARRLIEESRAIQSRLGDRGGIAESLYGLGCLACSQGDWAAAGSLLAESLMLSQETGDREGVAVCLERMAELAGARGQPERAARLFGAAEALREALGAQVSPADRPSYEQQVAALRVELGEAAFAAAWAAGRALSGEQAVAAALGEDEGGE